MVNDLLYDEINISKDNMFMNAVKFRLTQKKELFKDGIIKFDINDQITINYLDKNKKDINMIDQHNFNPRDLELFTNLLQLNYNIIP